MTVVSTLAFSPRPITLGTIYFATDSLKIYQYNSSAWSTIASASGSGGTVSTVSVATANGFAGTVATATTTPAITVFDRSPDDSLLSAHHPPHSQ
jgi:hypothetical protein